MKANEAITLEACLLALLHYGDSVPADLHKQIQTAKTELANGQPEAVKHLRKIMQQNVHLERLYNASREQLVVQYGQTERAKGAIATAPSLDAIPYSPSSLVLNLINVATDILSSPNANYRAKAQQVLNQPKLQKQLEQAPENLQVAVKEFAKAANQLHPIQVAMIRKIENNFFTLDDIAYSLQIPMESTQRYGKVLWNEGYIRPISSNLFKQLWWSFQGAPPLTQLPDPEVPLTLTTKGYFYLHPGTLGNKSHKSWRTV